MFDIMLTLNRGADVFKSFEIDQALQFMLFGETVHTPGAMLEYSAHKVTRDADIENSVRSIGQDVDVAAIVHAAIMKGVDGRDKPGHDEICP